MINLIIGFVVRRTAALFVNFIYVGSSLNISPYFLLLQNPRLSLSLCLSIIVCV